MQKIISVLIACFLLNNVFAQQGKISGTVTANGNALVAATVTIKPINRTIISDSAGHFHFTDIPYGNYSIGASAVNFIGNTGIISVKGDITRLNISLAENNSMMGEVVISGTMKPISKMDSF